ncbi:MAG: hypothetical protein WA061_01700 [Microgenomates group bacterium]
MSNMSYCRFQNTLKDLYDCDDHMFDNLGSESEQEAREDLLKLCKSIATMNFNDLPELENEEDEETDDE